MSDKPAALPRADAGPSFIALRIDARRDTRTLVQRNVSAHAHVTIGKGGAEAVLMLHPHAAKRLVANITAVLDGAEHAGA